MPRRFYDRSDYTVYERIAKRIGICFRQFDGLVGDDRFGRVGEYYFIASEIQRREIGPVYPVYAVTARILGDDGFYPVAVRRYAVRYGKYILARLLVRADRKTVRRLGIERARHDHFVSKLERDLARLATFHCISSVDKKPVPIKNACRTKIGKAKLSV